MVSAVQRTQSAQKAMLPSPDSSTIRLRVPAFLASMSALTNSKQSKQARKKRNRMNKA